VCVYDQKIRKTINLSKTKIAAGGVKITSTTACIHLQLLKGDFIFYFIDDRFVDGIICLLYSVVKTKRMGIKKIKKINFKKAGTLIYKRRKEMSFSASSLGIPSLLLSFRLQKIIKNVRLNDGYPTGITKTLNILHRQSASIY